jgi:hypothetical protein
MDLDLAHFYKVTYGNAPREFARLVIRANQEKYLEMLDTIEYTGHFNKPNCSKGGYFNNPGNRDAVEYRIGAMTFEYSEVIKTIKKLNKIHKVIINDIFVTAREFKNYASLKNFLHHKQDSTGLTLEYLKALVSRFYEDTGSESEQVLNLIILLVNRKFSGEPLKIGNNKYAEDEMTGSEAFSYFKLYKEDKSKQFNLSIYRNCKIGIEHLAFHDL